MRNCGSYGLCMAEAKQRNGRSSLQSCRSHRVCLVIPLTERGNDAHDFWSISLLMSLWVIPARGELQFKGFNLNKSVRRARGQLVGLNVER